MHHLLLGIDPVQLGGAPFTLAVSEALDLRAGEVGLRLNPAARLDVLPCIAGHVGPTMWPGWWPRRPRRRTRWRC